jgi:hypothetical protein
MLHLPTWHSPISSAVSLKLTDGCSSTKHGSPPPRPALTILLPTADLYMLCPVHCVLCPVHCVCLTACDDESSHAWQAANCTQPSWSPAPHGAEMLMLGNNQHCTVALLRCMDEWHQLEGPGSSVWDELPDIFTNVLRIETITGLGPR